MQTVDRETGRRQLLDQVFAASTLEEIAAAKQALRDWLAAHPDEPEMADALEVLRLSNQSADTRSSDETVAGCPTEAGLRTLVGP